MEITEPKPWERQINRGETAKSFEYFCAYRDMPPEERSLAAVAAKFGITENAIWVHSSKNSWVERASKYNDYLDEQKRKSDLRKVEHVRSMSVEAAKKMIQLAVEGAEHLDFTALSPREIREYAKAAVTLAELFKDESSEKLRGMVENSDTGAEVVIYLPEIDDGEGDG